MNCWRVTLPWKQLPAHISAHLSTVSPCTRHISSESGQGVLVLNAGSSSLKFNLFSLSKEKGNSVTSVLSGAVNGMQLPVVISSYQQLPLVTSKLPSVTISYHQLPVVTSSYHQLPVVTSSYQQLPIVAISYQQLLLLLFSVGQLTVS